MSYDFLGRNIKKFRKEKGFTLEELAKRVGTSHVTLSRYEREERRPKSEMINRIAEKLDVSIEDLLLDPLLNSCHSAVREAYSKILKNGLGKIVNNMKIYVYFQDELDRIDLDSIAEIAFDEINYRKDKEVYSDHSLLVSFARFSILEYLALINRNPKAQSLLSFSELDIFNKYDELFDALAPELLDRLNDENLPINKINNKINELQELLLGEYFRLELIDKIEILDDDQKVIKTLKH